MKITKAKREFKKRFGQVNHFLITTLIGLDAIEKGLVTNKPDSFSATWNPKDSVRSAQRARGFTLKSFLGWAVESLEMYLTELNRKPKLLESERFTQVYSKAGQKIYLKVTLVGQEAKIDPVLIALMEVLITWRNYIFHYDIDNKISENGLETLQKEKSRILDEFCGLDIDILKQTWESGRDFTFKEAASLISATHKYVDELDEFAVKNLNIERYVSETVLEHFEISNKSYMKYRSLEIKKKNRYLKSLIQDHVGIQACDELIIAINNKIITSNGQEGI